MKVRDIELDVILKSNFVVSPDTFEAADLEGKINEHTVRAACADALICAKERESQEIVLPALGVGGGEFSVVGSAKIMAQEILKFARTETGSVKHVVIYFEDQGELETFQRTARGYIDHIQDALGLGPYVTVDAVIEMDDGIVLIERSNPPYGWALPGGFVDCGESLETAVRREAKEETGLELENLRQMHTYSDPKRDPRFHTVTTVFVGRGKGEARFGDDAKGLKIVPCDELLGLEYAFDHHSVIRDYLVQKQ